MSRAKAQKEQEKRSRRYGIGIRDDGNLAKPKEWANLRDSQFGDPVNYLYPVADSKGATEAKRLFKEETELYENRSVWVVRGRLNRLLRKYSVEPMKASDDEPRQELTTPRSGSRFFAEVIQEELDKNDPHYGLLKIPAARHAVLTHPWWGDIHLDDDLFDSFIDNWQTDVIGFELAIDASHDPDQGALAWVKDIEINGDSFDLWVDPTILGVSTLGSVWKYASIEYREDYVDPETLVSYGPTLLGCAATNRPFVHRQEEIQVLSLGSRQCDDWQCKLSLKTEDTMEVTFDDADIIAGDSGNEEEATVLEDVGLTEQEDASPAEPVSESTPSVAEPQPDPVAISTQQPAGVVENNGVTLSRAEVERLLEQNEALLRREHERDVADVCERASARGVAPVVVATARQVLSAAQPSAPATIALSVPGEQGQDVTKEVNFFGAVSELMSLIPGYIEANDPLSYQYQEDRSTADNVTGNPYDGDDSEMTLEEAEEAARKRRQELNIRFTRATTSNAATEL
jgi:hypothetical protein